MKTLAACACTALATGSVAWAVKDLHLHYLKPGEIIVRGKVACTATTRRTFRSGIFCANTRPGPHLVVMINGRKVLVARVNGNRSIILFSHKHR